MLWKWFDSLLPLFVYIHLFLLFLMKHVEHCDSARAHTAKPSGGQQWALQMMVHPVLFSKPALVILPSFWRRPNLSSRGDLNCRCAIINKEGACLSLSFSCLRASRWAWQPSRAEMQESSEEKTESSSSRDRCANQFKETQTLAKSSFLPPKVATLDRLHLGAFMRETTSTLR